jgi:hypothetical protein
MTNWNRVFWAAFVILGAAVIVGYAARVLYLDVLFGLLVVGIGAAKLAEEIAHRRMHLRERMMHDSIKYLTRQVDSAASTAEHLRGSADSRFFRIDSRLRELGDNLDDKYEDSVKKVVQMENRLNDHTKMMLEIAKRQEAIKERQAEIAERLKHIPRGPRVPSAYAPKPFTTSVRIPSTETRPIHVPSTALVPEKKIMRFELPRIAPRKTKRKARPLRLKLRLKPKVRAKRKARTKPTTIINIQAPKPQVIKKIVRVRAKPRKARAKRKAVRAKRTVAVGKTVINIAAPKPQVIRKVVRVKAKPKPRAKKTVVAGKTTINIQAPKPLVKIVKVPAKTGKRAKKKA